MGAGSSKTVLTREQRSRIKTGDDGVPQVGRSWHRWEGSAAPSLVTDGAGGALTQCSVGHLPAPVCITLSEMPSSESQVVMQRGIHRCQLCSQKICIQSHLTLWLNLPVMSPFLIFSLLI